MSDPHWNLDELRQQIDKIDDKLHDLLMRRADLVASVGTVKTGERIPALRPGREAQILRRLMARHEGSFPGALVARIWRELMSGTIAMQVDFSVAVFAPAVAPGFWDLARDHYGSFTPMTAHGTASQVLRAVTEGSASVGVLAWPQEGDREAWWPQLVSADPQAPRVIARLPFAGPGNARMNGVDALAIGRGDSEVTGSDRSLLVLETRAEMSRGRLLTALKAGGFDAAFIAAVEQRPGASVNLLEVDGVVEPGDARLGEALAPLDAAVDRVSSLGGYASPLTSQELTGRRKGLAKKRG
jgi:chorismate mutase-like protein